MSEVSQRELRQLRNDLDVEQVLVALDVPAKRDGDGYLRFVCPHCRESHTATNARTNLARCFRCETNFNPIDLVVAVRRASFLQAVTYLRQLRDGLEKRDPKNLR